jgi:hypothetical protein
MKFFPDTNFQSENIGIYALFFVFLCIIGFSVYLIYSGLKKYYHNDELRIASQWNVDISNQQQTFTPIMSQDDIYKFIQPNFTISFYLLIFDSTNSPETNPENLPTLMSFGNFGRMTINGNQQNAYLIVNGPNNINNRIDISDNIYQRWNQFTITCMGSNVNIFINGQRKITHSLTNNNISFIPNLINDVEIANNSNVRAYMQLFHAFPRALNGTDVLNHYISTSETTGVPKLTTIEKLLLTEIQICNGDFCTVVYEKPSEKSLKKPVYLFG